MVPRGPTTDNNKRSHEEIDSKECLYNATSPQKIGGNGQTGSVVAAISPSPDPVQSLHPPQLSGVTHISSAPLLFDSTKTIHPSHFKLSDSPLHMKTLTAATEAEETTSAEVTQSKVYKDVVALYLKEQEKRIFIDETNIGLKGETTYLREEVERLKAVLRARDSPMALSLEAGMPSVALASPSTYSIKSNQVEIEIKRQADIFDLQKFIKGKDIQLSELRQNFTSLLSNNEKLKQRVEFTETQLNNHERTLSLICNLFGITHELSTSGDLLVLQIERFRNDFKCNEKWRINGNCIAKYEQMWNDEFYKLHKMYDAECEKHRAAVKEELEIVRKEFRELKEQHSEELKSEMGTTQQERASPPPRTVQIPVIQATPDITTSIFQFSESNSTLATTSPIVPIPEIRTPPEPKVNVTAPVEHPDNLAPILGSSTVASKN